MIMWDDEVEVGGFVTFLLVVKRSDLDKRTNFLLEDQRTRVWEGMAADRMERPKTAEIAVADETEVVVAQVGKDDEGRLLM
jgi:hypothetical protein